MGEELCARAGPRTAELFVFSPTSALRCCASALLLERALSVAARRTHCSACAWREPVLWRTCVEAAHQEPLSCASAVQGLQVQCKAVQGLCKGWAQRCKGCGREGKLWESCGATLEVTKRLPCLMVVTQPVASEATISGSCRLESSSSSSPSSPVSASTSAEAPSPVDRTVVGVSERAARSGVASARRGDAGCSVSVSASTSGSGGGGINSSRGERAAASAPTPMPSAAQDTDSSAIIARTRPANRWRARQGQGTASGAGSEGGGLPPEGRSIGSGAAA